MNKKVLKECRCWLQRGTCTAKCNLKDKGLTTENKIEEKDGKRI
jgi:hypothetical protein